MRSLASFRRLKAQCLREPMGWAKAHSTRIAKCDLRFSADQEYLHAKLPKTDIFNVCRDPVALWLYCAQSCVMASYKRKQRAMVVSCRLRVLSLRSLDHALLDHELLDRVPGLWRPCTILICSYVVHSPDVTDWNIGLINPVCCQTLP